MEESPAPPLEFILITGAQSPVGAAVAARLAASAPVLLQGAEKAPLMTPAGHVHPGPHLLWPHDLSDVENIPVSLGSLQAERASRPERISNKPVECAPSHPVAPGLAAS